MDTWRKPRSRVGIVVALAAAFVSGGAAFSAVQIAGATGTVTPEAACTGYPHYGVDWQGCDVVHANLINQYLGHANLADADLAYADLGFANLDGADLAGANLLDAYLVDSTPIGANLTGASLIDANVTTANLTKTVLINANLSGANLNGALLSSANLKGATGLTPGEVARVTWINTTCPDGTNSSSYSTQTCVGHGI